jgi:uncharacterized protein YbaR (Trm112 family)
VLIALTDVLTCPRCGPEHGLIVLADRLEHRRVMEGALGCANCRETFPITGGVADLRYPPQPAPAELQTPSPGDAEGQEEAFRMAALMGVAGGTGLVLLAGPAAALAGLVAGIMPDLGILAVGPWALAGGDLEGVSRMLAADRLPLRGGSMRGVSLTGRAASELFDEGIRVLAPGARLVVDPAPAEAEHRLLQRGFEILLSQERVLVAWRRA